MNAKTTKFLAVLAVLAMAFAAVAVFAPAENDAAEVTSAWTIETGKPWSITVGSDIIIPEDGQTLEDKTAYYVNEDMTLNLDKETDSANGAILVFVKQDVEATIVAPEEHDAEIAVGIIGVKESADKDGNTVLTLHANYTGKFDCWVNGTALAYPTSYAAAAGHANHTLGIAADRTGGTFVYYEGEDMEPGYEGDPLTYAGRTDSNINVEGSFGAYYGQCQTLKNYYNGSAYWELLNFTGTIDGYSGNDNPGPNMAYMTGFTGIVGLGSNGSIEVQTWKAGDITVLKGTVTVTGFSNTKVTTPIPATMPAESSITFANGVTVPTGWTVSYERFVVDKYTFTMTGSVKAGADGFTITAGVNGFELSGSSTVTTAGSWMFKGAAKVSGILNMDGKAFEIKKVENDEYQVTLENFRADNAGAGLTLSAETVFEGQVTVSGKVIAGDSMIVAPYAFVNITGEYRFVPAVATSLIYTFIGKDATLRVSQAVGPQSATVVTESTYTSDDARWATLAFVDVTGKFFLNQNLVTMASGAVITYLYQVGEGQVSVNSSICSKYSEYYLYKQVIPYLLLNPVDVVCTSLIAEEALISLTGVDYTETPVPTGNQARYSIDYTTGVPVLTVIFKELYPVEIQNAYANGVAKIEVIDEDGNQIFMEPDAQTPSTGIVKLAYTYDYVVKGVNENNKYTFYFDGDKTTGTKLEQINLYSSAFTMVRGYMTYDAADGNTPHYLTYEEGLGVELTVILDDMEYEQYSEGDVFMYFTTEVDEKGKPIGGTPVVLEAIKVGQQNKMGAIITKGVYSTDTVYFKSEYRLFYKLTAVKVDSENVVFPTVSGAEVATVDFSSKTWSSGFAFTNALVTKATLGVDCGLDTVEVKFVLPEGIPSGKKVYVDFSVYCDELDHKRSEKIDDAGTTTITMCVGEVYEITWDDIDGKFVTMTYDKTNPTTADPKDYTQGTEVTATSTDLTYTLKVEDIIYIIVENKTAADLTLTIGKYAADIEANKSNSKVIVNDGKDNTLVLSKKGYTVEGWAFTYTLGTTAATDTTAQGPVYVSGPQTINTYGYYDTQVTGKTIKKITITGADIKKTLYSVSVLKDDHGAIGDRDQNGYMGDTMKAFVSAQGGYNVVGVTYEYQEVDMPEKAIGYAERSYTSEGQEVWIYTMPASDVLLKPIIYKETRELSFVDQNGEVIETYDVEPATTVDMLVPHYILTTITNVTTEDLDEDEYEYDAETGYITFVMPDEDVEFTVTCEEIEYSKDVAVAITKTNAGLRVTVSALDGFNVLPGAITLTCTYWYYDEEDDVWDTAEVILDNVVAGESIVTSCLFAYADMPADTAYVQAIYDSIATDGDSGMIVY